MSSSVVASLDQGTPQGYCSRCKRVWALKERQGVCQWCGKLSSRQDRLIAPRQFKSRPPSHSKRQALSGGNGYEKLEGQWLTFYKVASRFSHKVLLEDREDLLHEIIVTLADVERNNGHNPFTEAVMYRIASVTVADYWFKHYSITNGLDCRHCSTEQRHRCKEEWLYLECPKAIKLEYLEQPVTDAEGNLTELGELIIDDKALDLDGWVSRSTWEIGYPRRLIAIAYKLHKGEALTVADRKYLCKWRKRDQIILIGG